MLLGLLTGCAELRAPERSAPAVVTPAAVALAAAAPDWLDAAGAAPFVVLLPQAAFLRERGAALAYWKDRPELPRELRPLLRALRAPELLAGLWQVLGRPGPAPALPGLDPQRPVVLALMEVARDVPNVRGADTPPQGRLPASLGAAAVAVFPGAPPTEAPLIHRVLLPATEPGSLERSIADVLGRLGLRPRGPARFTGRLGTTGLVVQLWAGRDHLRLDVLTHAEDYDGHLPPGLLDRVVPPPGPPPADTPAWRFARRRAAAGAGLFIVHIRPDRLRDLAVQQYRETAGFAVMQVDPPDRWLVWGKIFAETAGGYLLLSGPCEVTDATLSWTPAPAVHADLLFSLGPAGPELDLDLSDRAARVAVQGLAAHTPIPEHWPRPHQPETLRAVLRDGDWPARVGVGLCAPLATLAGVAPPGDVAALLAGTLLPASTLRVRGELSPLQPAGELPGRAGACLLPLIEALRDAGDRLPGVTPAARADVLQHLEARAQAARACAAADPATRAEAALLLHAIDRFAHAVRVSPAAAAPP